MGSAGHIVMPRPSPRVKHPSSCLTAGLSGLLTAVTLDGLYTTCGRWKQGQDKATSSSTWQEMATKKPLNRREGKEAKPMEQQKKQIVKVGTRSEAPALLLHPGQAFQKEWRPRSPQLQQEPLQKGNSTL